MPGTMIPGDGVNWDDFDDDEAALVQEPGSYEDYTVIARWDEAPNRTVAGSRTISIVAFHANGGGEAGVAWVKFYLRAGEAVTALSPTLNPITGRYAWCAILDTSLVGDEKVEIRAIVQGLTGWARVFNGPLDASAAARERGEHSLFVMANNGGTLPAADVYCNSVTGDDGNDGLTPGTAFETMYAATLKLKTDGTRDGGTIHVTGGEASWPAQAASTWDDNDQYCTVSLEGDATITALDGSNYAGLGCTLQRIVGEDRTVNKIVGVKVLQALDTPGIVAGGAWIQLDEVGIDGVTEEGAAGVNETTFGRGWGIENFKAQNLDTGIALATRVVNGEISNIGEDVLVNNQGLIADLDIHDTRQVPPGHGDLIQHNTGFGGSPNGLKNTIYYNIRTRRVGIAGEGVQGFFLRSNGDIGTHEDLALVDCDFAYAGNSQILHDVTHLVIWHSQFLPNAETGTGGTFLIIDDAPGGWPTTTILGISVRNSVFYTFTTTWSGGEDPTSNGWANNNHYISGGSTPGTDITTGSTLAALFVDPDTEDYRPNVTGSLAGRREDTLVTAAWNGTLRFEFGAIGAWELSTVPPPDLQPKTIRFQYGEAVSALLVNDGPDVEDCEIDDPEHAPIGIDVEPSNGTVRVFGEPEAAP